MRYPRVLLAIVMALLVGRAGAQTPAGSAFTYQGKLTDQGQPANGPYDLAFTLMDAASGGVAVGPSVFLNDVPVANGLFTVPLDFGSAALNGSARWLSILVRPGASSGAYTPLTPLQRLTPAPYAAGLALPYSATQSSPGPLVNLVQTGSGGALAGTVQNGVGTAVYGQASGVGSIGVWGYNLATSGFGGYFRNESPTNASPALLAESGGNGPALQANSNTGIAWKFDITNSTNGESAVQATTAGTGRAGTFQNTKRRQRDHDARRV